MSNDDNLARNSSRENGSAYVLVLMVLLVLTLLGLVLAFITQSEVEVGANERNANRVFYGTEAGITAAVVSLNFNDRSAKDMRIMDPGSTTQGTHVVIPALLEVNTGPCNLCEINQGNDFQDITHSASVTASRFALDGNGTETVLSTKNVDLMVEIQPVRPFLQVGPDADKLNK